MPARRTGRPGPWPVSYTHLPAGTVLSAAILNPDGSVAHAAGTILRQDLTLAANMKLAPGAL